VLMLYSDPAREIEAKLDSLTARPPDMTALDLNQDGNRLWKVDDSNSIAAISQMMSDKTVIIADGHHRYEVALAFRQESAPKIREEKRLELYGYKLMSFVRLESEGLTILPIHRLLHSLVHFEPAQFLARLTPFFSTQESSAAGDQKFSHLETLMEDLAKRQLTGQNAFGLYLPGTQKYVLLRFKREGAEKISWPVEKSVTWRKLD